MLPQYYHRININNNNTIITPSIKLDNNKNANKTVDTFKPPFSITQSKLTQSINIKTQAKQPKYNNFNISKSSI